MRRTLTSLSLMLSLAACGGSPAMSPQYDQEAKQFQPPPAGTGALYVFRKELMTAARPIDVGIVGGATARLAINTYLRIEGPPGPVEIDCKLGDQTGALQAQIEDGRTTFVEVSTKVGLLLPGCAVAEVAPAEGQAAVRASRRVESQ